MKFFENYQELLRGVNIGSIARETGVDEYSKKLEIHLKLLVCPIVEDCVSACSTTPCRAERQQRKGWYP